MALLDKKIAVFFDADLNYTMNIFANMKKNNMPAEDNDKALLVLRETILLESNLYSWAVGVSANGIKCICGKIFFYPVTAK